MKPANHKRILVVDDEPQITRVLRTSLDAHGYDLRVANDGETALQIAHDWPPDLMITDLSMPVMDGLEVCRRFRLKSNAPIIVLSVKGEERTKVLALDAGADDYVTKPFGINELLARVRVVRGRELKLTPKEFELLVYLARNPHKVVTHRKLLSAVWGAASTEQPEYLRVFIGQLRKKIEADTGSPSYILTEPWVGYRFEPKGVTSR